MNIRFADPRKLHWEGAVLVTLGLLLLTSLRHWHGAVALLAMPGGALLTASGTAMLLFNGDSRLPQFAALGAFLALIVMPFLALSGEALSALFLSLGCIAAWLAAGRVSLDGYPQIEGAPTKPAHLKAAALIALDEALMAWFKLIAQVPRGEQARALAQQVAAFEDYLGRKRLRSRLHALHPQPPDLIKVEAEDRRLFGQDYRHITFDSTYAPDEDMPGAKAWMRHSANRQAHVRILEHPGGARPWLLCIHGYRMGNSWLDMRLFDPAFLHHKLGLNLAMPVLPLHGPRKRGLLSGEGFLDGDVVDFVHAECQAQWDLRRVLSYLRLVKHAPAIGVYGISLGGYNAALLSGLDDELACVVAGIPVVDMALTQWRHFPAAERAALEQLGIHRDRISKLMAAVSPLSYKPLLAAEKLGIFAGSIDSLVWPDHARMLQHHWDGASLNWYEGSHLSFAHEPALRETLLNTFQAGGLIDER